MNKYIIIIIIITIIITIIIIMSSKQSASVFLLGTSKIFPRSVVLPATVLQPGVFLLQIQFVNFVDFSVIYTKFKTLDIGVLGYIGIF
jgi:hypothetical protein